MRTPVSAADVQVVSKFEGLRKRLKSAAYADRLNHPLAYWAVHADRGLPRAFLSRPIREILETPYDELMGTRGVGIKKMAALVHLLARAATSDPKIQAWGGEESVEIESLAGSHPSDPEYDSKLVTEPTWAAWRAAVDFHGLADEPLGRYASSLQHMTRPIWDLPLSTYTSTTLGDLRRRRTYGEKRVRAILEVFGNLHTIVSDRRPAPHLTARIVPVFTARLADWVEKVIRQANPPPIGEVRRSLVDPLLTQIEIDAGTRIAGLVRSRLGLTNLGPSARVNAHKLGLTRARVYQLLDEVADILQVRWPEGQLRLTDLRTRAKAEGWGRDDLPLLHSAVDLFFVDRRPWSAGANGRAAKRQAAAT